MLPPTCDFFAIKYTKYAYVNATILIFNGIYEMRSFVFPILRALHIGLFISFVPGLNNSPVSELNMITTEQLINNNPKNITPLTSVFNIDDNTKKQTNMNGMIRNPTYNNGTKFIIFESVNKIIYI
jgi:hypothetical protein